MLSFFRFRRSRGPVDLTLGMAGIRLGERLLQAGVGDPEAFAALAGKVGLTGHAAVVVETPEDGSRLEAAAADAGVLIDVVVAAAGSWPCAESSADLAVVDANELLARDAAAQDALCRDLARCVRGGGRVLVIHRRALGVSGRLGFEPGAPAAAVAEPVLAILHRAGFAPARFLADREGLTFVEAFRPRS